MDEHRHDSDAGDANQSESGVADDASTAAFGGADAANTVVAPPSGQIGVARQDVAAAISDKLTYTLTVEDAQERFARARRKVPSIRSLQRYCQDGLIKGVRTPVTYDDGSHAEPWFINDASLDAYIKQQPIVVLGDVSDAKPQMATPNREVGDATLTAPVSTGDAGGAKTFTADGEVPPSSTSTPAKDEPPSIPLAEVLLENARLQERLEGKNEVLKRIEEGYDRERKEWHSERDFLRTDVTETRALVRDFKSVSDRILDTFKQIGTKQSETANAVEPGQILYKPVQNGESTGESRQA